MNRHFAPLFPVILEVSITAIGDTVQGVSSVEGTFFITIKSIGRQKMKRKLLFAAMATLMAIYSAIGLAACKPSGEETEHKHQMQHVAAVAATCTEGGNSEYWTCSACGKYFSDAEGKKRLQTNPPLSFPQRVTAGANGRRSKRQPARETAIRNANAPAAAIPNGKR